jgi:pyruvate/2-oxoglutarate dehydrogenase complex dihydrolipoamide dehydrogenase (E3) component
LATPFQLRAQSQIEILPRILIREDEEVSAFVRGRLEAEGVKVFTDHPVLRAEALGRAPSRVDASVAR